MRTAKPDHASTAERQGDLDSLRAENLRLRNVHEFAAQLLPLNSLDDVLWRLVRTFTEKLACKDCTVYLFDTEFSVLEARARGVLARSGKLVPQKPSQAPRRVAIVDQAGASDQALLANANGQPLSADNDRDFVAEIAIPLRHHQENIGIIYAHRSGHDSAAAQWLDVTEELASIAAHKITQAQGVERLEQTVKQLEYAEKLQRALFDIAQLSFATQALSEFFSTLHDIIGRLMYAENFYVAICDLTDQTLSFGYFRDAFDDFDTEAKYPLDRTEGGITAYLMRHREPLLVDSTRLAELNQAGKVQIVGTPPESWLGAPFYPEPDVMGAVVVQSYDPAYRYSESDKELLAYVSQHISTALQHKTTEQKLHYQALHDPLTGLANRLLFIERLGHALQRMDRNQVCHAVLFLDLDKFKAVNDTMGHAVGDDLLVETGGRILGCLRKEDTLARLGGDEFAVLLEDTDPLKVVNIARRIGTNLQRPFEIQNHAVSVSSSIGVALVENNDTPPAELLEQADNAMYQAKKQGPGRVVVFDGTQQTNHEEDTQIQRDIATGLEGDEFELYYQPIVWLATGAPYGMEVLLRWNHPKRGLVAPDIFIPVAESSGLILELDRYVLACTAKQLVKWQKRYSEPLSVSVNLSGQEFSSPHLVREVATIYKRSKLRPGALCLELTETALIQNLDSAARIITELHQVGAELSLDDFGTGYSSLSYLHRLRMHTLKIDRSFVATMNTNAWQENPIINTIIALARALDMQIVAEGIETQAQHTALQKLGCRLGQGFLMAKPMPKNALEAWLDQALSKTRE